MTDIFKRLVFYLVAAGFFVPGALATPIVCAEGKFRLHGGSAPEADAVCKALIRARAFLADCGLEQREPVEIHIVEQFDEDPGNALLGTCSQEDGHIELLGWKDFQDRLFEDSPLAALPSRELYDSLIVHELSHALFFQATGANPQCRAANEYVASAMQIAFLSQESRNKLLAGFRPLRDGGLTRFNQFVLVIDPIAFGVNAYLHFSRPENGCSFIGRIISRDVVFPDEKRRGARDRN